MTRPLLFPEGGEPLLEELVAYGEATLPLDERVERAQALRRTRERSRQLDRFLIEYAVRKTEGLIKASQAQQRVQELADTLLEPPWHLATFVRVIAASSGRAGAVVAHAGAQRIVGVGEGIDANALAPGDAVALGKGLNVIVARWPDGAPVTGDIALFDRRIGDGRLVLRWRDEEVAVSAAAALRECTLQPGDPVRWDRTASLALEKFELPDSAPCQVDDIPDIGRQRLGGQDDQIEALLMALTATLVAPEAAARYRIGARSAVLLYGPPGCGKTLMARIAAAEVARLAGRRRRFFIVKPAELENEFVGVTPRLIRSLFQSARAAAATGAFAFIYLDEVEAIGRLRGASGNHHGDKHLASLLAEVDGWTGRDGVAIVASTNRKDLIDPALLQRLSEVEILVGRPNRDAARAIFAVHLPEDLPYSTATGSAAATRAEAIEAAVTRFYAPNADNALATLKLRDGTTRRILARELASGRVFEQICRAACRVAFARERRGGPEGLRVNDVEDAAEDAFERLASTLSPRNAHAYLPDLPQDVDVIAVQPIVRRLARPQRYWASPILADSRAAAPHGGNGAAAHGDWA